MGYPVELNVKGKKCFVVGGGRAAARKVYGLLQASADVTVMAFELHKSLEQLHRKGKIDWLKEPYQSAQLNGMFLVIVAADDRETNLRVVREAREKGILVSIAGDRKSSDFWHPTVLRRGDLKVAVSSGGNSAVFSSRVRQDIERRIGPEYGELLKLMVGIRRQAHRKGLTAKMLLDLQNVLYDDAELKDLLRQKRKDEATRRAQSIFERLLEP